MAIDARSLDELLTESEDLQSDAIATARASLPDLRDIASDRRQSGVQPDEIAAFNSGRRDMLRRIFDGAATGAGRGLLGTGLGAALIALLAKPASAQQSLDVQMLQTASSLERLAVGTYGVALTLDFIKNGNPVVVKFAQTTMSQHDEHRQAFQAQTRALGGTAQDQPNPKFAQVVETAKPTLKEPLDVVTLAAALEQVATNTYLVDLTMLGDTKSKEVMGSVMGVESQHLATLRAVKALLEANAPQLIAIPVQLAQLPAAAGTVAFPKAFQETPAETVAAPETGAVK